MMIGDRVTLHVFTCAILALVACPNPTPPNPPPQPDADAAPAPPIEAGPLPPSPSDAAPSACESACSNMATLGCAGVRLNCSSTLGQLVKDRLIVNRDGKPVTCECLMHAADKAAVQSCGIGCP